MLVFFAVVLVPALAALLIYAAARPDAIHVERSAAVKATPERIFPFINDFHEWSAWSPYERLDPAMKKTYSGPSRGPGAVYEWQGNNKVGQGRMEITAADPASRITIKLDFLKPFEGHNVARFELAPRNDTTIVTWMMDGSAAYMMKLMGIFVDVDNMIGKDFEIGLANLKAIAER